MTLIQSPGDLGFSWQVNTSRIKPVSCGTLKLCVGISNEYQLRLCYGIQNPVMLEIIRTSRRSFKEIDVQCDNQQKPLLSTSGLPILDSTAVMDFDEAVGLIVLGGCRGDVCIIQFVDGSLHARRGLLDHLPPVRLDLASMSRVRCMCSLR